MANSRADEPLSLSRARLYIYTYTPLRTIDVSRYILTRRRRSIINCSDERATSQIYALSLSLPFRVQRVSHFLTMIARAASALSLSLPRSHKTAYLSSDSKIDAEREKIANSSLARARSNGVSLFLSLSTLFRLMLMLRLSTPRGLVFNGRFRMRLIYIGMDLTYGWFARSRTLIELISY